MKIAFVVASTDHGTMIINRNDENENKEYGRYGVGSQLLETGGFYPADTDLLTSILRIRKQAFARQRSIVAIDCGANIGVHTLEFARELQNEGSVLAIEAQRAIYYALCGNIAINNLFNVEARNVAVGSVDGFLTVPFVDYHTRSSFGSLELREREGKEYIGQEVDYARGYEVPLVTLDSLCHDLVDLVKIDVEGMEGEVISGAIELLKMSRPVLFVERIKGDFNPIEAMLKSLDYEIVDLGPNILAVSNEDSTKADVMRVVANLTTR
ncbi:FkbM family methyltransferase [Burkholderia gladioli]|uniref:FkbM family methyltransferase n=1 Tax=Burkholderia gladioli TaxID=28095 RepID=UPI000AA41F10|nr:FkbM family methyltransferase [Burkholderia gladioli]MBW5286518.1 FkbM family methyltransferase [Burkholderia gladioli]